MVDNQQNQKEMYLKGIRERVDHMSAIHHVVKERLEEKLAMEERAEEDSRPGRPGCQMENFDPFLSLDCTRVEGVGWGAIQAPTPSTLAQSKERKGSNFAA